MTETRDPEPRTDCELKLFEALAREHSELLYTYIASCVGRTSLADDVYQDTLVTAWRRIRDFDQTRPFGAWLRGIARLQIRAHRRERAAQLSLSDELLDALSTRFAAVERQAGDDLQAKLAFLRQCVGALAERDREALEIRYQEGLRGSPLAERLSTSIENGKKIVQRARARLHPTQAPLGGGLT